MTGSQLRRIDRAGPAQHHRDILRLTFSALLFLVAAAAGADEPPLRVLFIGNSLTYSNGLPSMVSRLGTAAGRRITTRSVAEPDFSLEDHLSWGPTAREIARGGWDVVVLQQGPSSLDASRRQLVHDTREIATRIRARSPGVRIALLMVWPGLDRASALGRVAESYRQAAEAVGGLLVPAGTALAKARQADELLPLFSRDGFHPAPAGSWIAAVTTFAVIAGPPPAATFSPPIADRVAGSGLALTQLRLERIRAALEAALREAAAPPR